MKTALISTDDVRAIFHQVDEGPLAEVADDVAEAFTESGIYDV